MNQPPPIRIRDEASGDEEAIRQVVTAAFGQPDEAAIVDRLRERGELTVSLVAEARAPDAPAPAIVAHVAFSPVTIDGQHGGVRWLGLAPVAVSPDWQRQGIGSRLIEAGLQRCRGLGAELVVVLGEPEYYSRFGFEVASRFGLQNPFGVDEPFRVHLPEAERGEVPQGMVAYSPAVMGTD